MSRYCLPKITPANVREISASPESPITVDYSESKQSVTLKQEGIDPSEQDWIAIPLEHWHRLDGIVRELTGLEKETYAQGYRDGEATAMRKYSQENKNGR